MKVIVLDFDGVLNSRGSFLYETRKRDALDEFQKEEVCPVNETLCNVCCSNFQYILDKVPDAKIVISSSWRNLYELDWLKDKLSTYGIDSSRVIDKTPSVFSGDRGREVKLWLNDHPDVKEYVILDDNRVDGFDEDVFVRTSWNAGLTLEHSLKAIQILGIKLSVVNRDLYV